MPASVQGATNGGIIHHLVSTAPSGGKRTVTTNKTIMMNGGFAGGINITAGAAA